MHQKRLLTESWKKIKWVRLALLLECYFKNVPSPVLKLPLCPSLMAGTTWLPWGQCWQCWFPVFSVNQVQNSLSLFGPSVLLHETGGEPPYTVYSAVWSCKMIATNNLIIFLNLQLGRVGWKLQKTQSFAYVETLYIYSMYIITNIIHYNYNEKSDWSREFNQYTTKCELDNGFIMSTSKSAWSPSPSSV